MALAGKSSTFLFGWQGVVETPCFSFRVSELLITVATPSKTAVDESAVWIAASDPKMQDLKLQTAKLQS